MDGSESTRLAREVNPVFTTAQACLLVMAEAGDADAQALARELGFDAEAVTIDEDALTGIEAFKRMKAIPGFTTTIEARFTASSNLAQSGGLTTVVDLPCGYTPRGLQFSRSGTPYLGLDLPTVVSAMQAACSDMGQQDTAQRYRAVDATNYDSVRTTLDTASGELFVTTEGLLMYLTQSELEEVFRSIRHILAEFGGVWVTTDNMMVATQEKIMRATSNSTEPFSMPQGAPKPNNAFFEPTKAEAFVKRMGFSLEKIPVFDYLPAQLSTLAHYTSEVQEKARLAFKEMLFWVMRPDATNRQSCNLREDAFAATLHPAEKTLVVTLSGRLDTITSPDFLSSFRQEAARGTYERVVIDMGSLSYLSSAGIRVLLLMNKEIPDAELLLRNVPEHVGNILEMTGLSEIIAWERR